MEYNITINEYLASPLNGCRRFRIDDTRKIPNWVYQIRLCISIDSIGHAYKWFNCKVEENIIELMRTLDNELYSNEALLKIDELELHKLKYSSVNTSVPIIPDNELNEKVSHLEKEHNVLKNKIALLENKLKYYEGEIGLIKSSLGL